jgi:hypothetical protein
MRHEMLARMLGPLPSGFSATRDRLHAVAAEVLSPPAYEATGHIHLVATPGGFGTPPLPDGRRLRVEGAALVREPGGTREPLDGVDEVAARWLADFYALALDVLESLRAEWPPSYEVSPPKLWPEHFDYAVEAGTVRANYGFSPGDADHPEPYAYVGPWEARPVGELWNARGFPGAELAAVGLTPDSALAFMRDRAAELHA